MRAQYIQKAQEFLRKWGPLDNTYLKSEGLEQIKYRNYQHLLPQKDLVILFDSPCPTHYPKLDYKYIRLLKLFRGYAGISEEKVCSRCPKQTDCALKFVTMNGRPNIAELIRLSLYLLNSPNTDLFYLTTYLSFFHSLDNLLNTLLVDKATQLRVLSSIEGDSPINSTRKPKLPAKLVWAPSIKDQERALKLSKC